MRLQHIIIQYLYCIVIGFNCSVFFTFTVYYVYLFGTHDKSDRTPQKFFKRKEQLRLSEMWVSENIAEVTECSLPSDTTFILGWPGWPITNCVAAFSTPEEKKLWFTSLSKYVVDKSTTIEVIYSCQKLLCVS